MKQDAGVLIFLGFCCTNIVLPWDKFEDDRSTVFEYETAAYHEEWWLRENKVKGKKYNAWKKWIDKNSVPFKILNTSDSSERFLIVKGTEKNKDKHNNDIPIKNIGKFFMINEKKLISFNKFVNKYIKKPENCRNLNPKWYCVCYERAYIS